MKNLNLIIVIFLAFITVSCNSNYKLTEKTPKLKYEMAQPQIRHYQKTDLKQTVKSITETTNADNLNLEVINHKPQASVYSKENKTTKLPSTKEETVELETLVEELEQTSNQQTETITNHEHHNKGSFWGYTGLIGLLTLGLGLPLIKKAKSMSLWASRNKKQSQTLLTLSHIGLGATGFYLGNQLAGEGILSSELTSQILFGTASIATALYPSRKKKTGLFKYSFFKAKMFSLFLALTGFALMMNVGNNWAENKHNAASPIEVVSNFEASEHNNTVVMNNDEPERVVLRILGTIGVVILSIILLYIVAIFSCMLACSNMGALAVVVLLGGLAGTIFLAVFLLKSIWKRKPKKDLSFSS